MKMKALLVLAGAVLLIFMAATLQAEEKKIILTTTTIKDNLNLHMGKRVELILESGQKLNGIVAKVGEHMVHIEKLSDRSYYDAAVKIESIDAVVVRARER